MTNEEAQKKVELQIAYRELPPAVLIKLQSKNGDPSKRTKKEIVCIIYSLFLALQKDKNKKYVLVDVLLMRFTKDPTKPHFCVRRARFVKATSALEGAQDPDELDWGAPFILGVQLDLSAPIVPMCDLGDERPSSV
jgi:hypothetical protein